MNRENNIIKLLKEHDKNAISLLYDSYGAAIYGVVLRIVKATDLAETVTQDVFIKAWKNAEKYDAKKGKLFTWLLNIARNASIDMTRSSEFKNRQKTQSFDFLVYREEQGITETSIDTIGLDKIVNQLEEKYRKVIDLAYFKGYTQKEIEKELDIPVGTVKTRLRIALRELRKFFIENAGLIALLLISIWMTLKPYINILN